MCKVLNFCFMTLRITNHLYKIIEAEIWKKKLRNDCILSEGGFEVQGGLELFQATQLCSGKAWNRSGEHRLGACPLTTIFLDSGLRELLIFKFLCENQEGFLDAGAVTLGAQNFKMKARFQHQESGCFSLQSAWKEDELQVNGCK